MEIPNEGTMLIRFSCKDLGLNCSFIEKGETLEEVTKKALEHVLDKHGDEFNNLLSPAEIEQMELAISRSTKVVVG
jgi:predicted small metal-binding protein